MGFAKTCRMRARLVVGSDRLVRWAMRKNGVYKDLQDEGQICGGKRQACKTEANYSEGSDRLVG